MCPLDDFSKEEVDSLFRYGAWMSALTSQRIEPYTEAQKHFVRMCQGERPALTELEKLWKKYLAKIDHPKGVKEETAGPDSSASSANEARATYDRPGGSSEKSQRNGGVGFVDRLVEEVNGVIMDVERTKDLSDEEKITFLIRRTGIVCGAAAVMPIPFADLFILTPIQGTMCFGIARIKGLPIEGRPVTDIMKEIAGVVGGGILAQQTTLALFKLGLPGAGGIATIPLVYGWTWGIGRVAEKYYTYRLEQREITPTVEKELKGNFWREFRKGFWAGRKTDVEQEAQRVRNDVSTDKGGLNQ